GCVVSRATGPREGAGSLPPPRGTPAVARLDLVDLGRDDHVVHVLVRSRPRRGLERRPECAARLRLALAAAQLEPAPWALPRAVHPAHVGAAAPAGLYLAHQPESTRKTGRRLLLHSTGEAA